VNQLMEHKNAQICWGARMDDGSIDRAAEVLRAHRTKLEALGMAHVSIFRSFLPATELGLVVRLDPAKMLDSGLAEFGRQRDIEWWLGYLIGAPVDLIPEPTLGLELQQAINRDCINVY
jgi:hypothetical protein